jgi:hypothetical protein
VIEFYSLSLELSESYLLVMVSRVSITANIAAIEPVKIAVERMTAAVNLPILYIVITAFNQIFK